MVWAVDWFSAPPSPALHRLIFGELISPSTTISSPSWRVIRVINQWQHLLPGIYLTPSLHPLAPSLGEVGPPQSILKTLLLI